MIGFRDMMLRFVVVEDDVIATLLNPQYRKSELTLNVRIRYITLQLGNISTPLPSTNCNLHPSYSEHYLG